MLIYSLNVNIHLNGLQKKKHLTGLVELRRRLFNLQGDLKAIEARVENIGERIGELLGMTEQQEIASDEQDIKLKSKQRADYLMKEHMKLTQQWLNLKEALKQRVNRISTEGQVSRFLEKLDSFQDWMRKLKSDVFVREFPSDLQPGKTPVLYDECYTEHSLNYHLFGK
ncbi:hypothetical protein Smp_012600 [Schistosoma mansoni]|uniref:hypothetical protein n=1 Tax=Schistosoma mansoni TaxID=6183 RepID=UPI0001A6340B|nr:hypothetical protein Smp_012600 [Schistosoma mansoni]|eukprot:XP_018648136.1 hypothetical protein Smp_012600 [Schistosoma mansoni]